MIKPAIKFLLIFSCLILIHSTYSQVEQKLYFDKNWKICKSDDAKFFRYIELDTTTGIFNGEFVDFTIDSLRVTSGKYTKSKKSGVFKFYNENGILQSVGNFNNDVPEGSWMYYYSNGEVEQEIVFTKTNFQIVNYYNSIGNNLLESQVINWRKSFHNDFSRPTYQIVGKIVNGKKDGRWEIWNDKEAIGYDLYKEGKFKKSRYFDASISVKGKLIQNELFIPFYLLEAEKYNFKSNVSRKDYPLIKTLSEVSGIPAVGIRDDSVVFKVDYFPTYAGGYKNVLRILSMNLRYPPEAVTNNIVGTVYVELIIDETGNLVSRKISRSAYGALNAEALRVSGMLVDWEPAIYNGEAVKCRVTLPIKFNAIIRQ